MAGYYLYYGTASGVYTGSVNAARNTTATLTDLAPGTAYFCVVIAYTAEGQQSAPSNEASFTTAPRARAPRPAGPGAPEPVSPPAVINAMQRLPNGSFQLTLTTPGNSLAGVSIYASSDLKTWTLLGSLPNSTLPFTVTDPEAAFFDRRFYRFSSP